MTSLKEWMDQQWRNPGVRFSGHGVAYIGTCFKDMQVRGGSNRTYKSKEQKAYEARFGIYNKKLVPIILAEATRDDRFSLPRYSWPKEAEAAQVAAPAVAVIPRKRVSHKKVTQAAAILAKVPQDELTAFLAKFGLSLSLAASIASLDNVEQIARQFLRATL
jgi:hypothetical protein